jgi:hypothetical protein
VKVSRPPAGPERPFDARTCASWRAPAGHLCRTDRCRQDAAARRRPFVRLRIDPERPSQRQPRIRFDGTARPGISYSGQQDRGVSQPTRAEERKRPTPGSGSAYLYSFFHTGRHRCRHESVTRSTVTRCACGKAWFALPPVRMAYGVANAGATHAMASAPRSGLPPAAAS